MGVLAAGCSSNVIVLHSVESGSPGSEASDSGDGSSDVRGLSDETPSISMGDGAVVEDACPPCPRSVVVNGGTPTNQLGGLDSGVPSLDDCPQGEAVIGYHGSTADDVVTENGAPTAIIGSIQSQCGHLVVVDDGPASAVTVLPGTMMLEHGEPRPSTWMSPCPANAVVIGFVARTTYAVGQLRFQCAGFVVSKTADGDVVHVDLASVTTLEPAGGANGMPVLEVCPPGQVARGSNIRSGSWVDAFGINCGRPVLLPPETDCCRKMASVASSPGL